MPTAITDWPAHALVVDQLLHSEKHPDGIPVPDGWRAGPAAMLANLASTGHTEHVVVVGPALFRDWGLPEQLPRHPVDWQLPVAGWVSGQAGPWVTLVAPGPRRVYLALWPWLAAGRHPDRDWPLFAGLFPGLDQHAVRARLRAWIGAVGTSYRGTPGVAAMASLRAAYPAGAGRGPLWHLPPNPILERAYEPELYWTRSKRLPGERGEHLHTYDRRRAYLAALATVEVAAGPLSFRGAGSRFDPSRAGWWRIEADPWPHKDRMPDPLEDLHDLGGVWVTTPTVQLLTDLTEQGLYGGYSVRESWTGPKSRVFRKWSTMIRDALNATSSLPDDPTAAAVAETLKQCYRQAVGLMARAGGAIHRPDWHHAVIAQSRCTLWRRTWHIGRDLDVWPARIQLDSVSYVSSDPSPISANPGLSLGEGLGGWRIVQPKEAHTHA